MKQMLKGSDKIAQASYDNYQCMDLKQEEVPAILVYGGIQYTYMTPQIFNDEQFAYGQEHVFILSGFYGVLKA